jgi:hypothetical protein
MGTLSFFYAINTLMTAAAFNVALEKVCVTETKE